MTSTHPLITRPGGYSAKNTRPVGAPNNHQGSGENPMVGTILVADEPTVTKIQNQLYTNAERFVQFDHPSGSVIVHFGALAGLVHELIAAHTAELRAERDAVARESAVRHNEILELIDQLERAEAERAQFGRGDA